MRHEAPFLFAALCLSASLLPACAGSGSSPSDAAAPESAVTVAPASTAPAAVGTAAAPTAQPASSASAAGDALPSAERLADLAPGATTAEVEKALGRPAKRSPSVEEQATGELASTWSWADGESAIMAAPRGAAPRLRILVVAGQSKRKTSRGIGVGSSRKEVEAAYGSAINKELSNDELVLIGADMYDGLKLHLDDKGKVSSIALGADGE